MKNSPLLSDSLSALRRKAVHKLLGQIERLDNLSGLDIRMLVQELGTHQIELEMQNEELRSAQQEIEASRSRYMELYDFAPVGYFTIDKKGLIREINLTCTQLLGSERQALLNQPFISFIPEARDRAIFHKHSEELLTAQGRLSCEIVLRRKDGSLFYAQLQSTSVVPGDEDTGHIRSAVFDITERRRLEEERGQLIRDLRKSLSDIKTLQQLLPICSYCKKIRDDKGYWQKLESYIAEATGTYFSHGICPECIGKVEDEISKLKRPDLTKKNQSAGDTQV